MDESPATKTIVMMLTKTSLSKKFKPPSSPPPPHKDNRDGNLQGIHDGRLIQQWQELPELPPDIEDVADLDPEDFKAPPASSLRVEDNPEQVFIRKAVK